MPAIISKNSVLLLVIVLLGMAFTVAAQEPDWNAYKTLPERLVAMQQYGRDCIKKQQFDQAIAVVNKGLGMSQQASLDSFSGSNLILLAGGYRYKSMFDSSLYFLQRAKEIADRKKYSILQAMIQIESYGVYNRMGKADSTAVIIGRLKEILPALDSNSRESARIQMYLGHDDKHKANYTEALAHYYKALRSFIHLGDSLNEGNIYISLATVLVNLGQQDKALYYHQQAAALFTIMCRKSELATELINITDMYYTSNRLDSAELSVQKALTIAQSLNDKVVAAYAYLHLGNIYNRRRKFPEAEKYFLQSIKIGEPAGIDNALGETYQGLGEMYMAQQLPAKAAPYLLKHFMLAKQDNDNGEMMEGALNLAQNEEALHHYDKAFAYQKLYSSLKDSAYTASSAKSMAEMETRYQAEKKEKEIVLLKKDQELNQLSIQKQKNFQLGAIVLIILILLIGFLLLNRYKVVQRAKQLVDMERMRNNIARDLHDDIGSTLSSINILSKVALQQEAGQQHAMAADMQKIKDRSAVIMDSMSDIVWAIHPQNDTVEQMIARMKEFTAELLDPLNINYTFRDDGGLSDVKLDIKTRKDIYLLFKEAVNNAAKYSRCSNVAIHLWQEAQSLRLSVTDDGIGFQLQQQGSGNGLRNMRERASSMGAVCEINSTPGKGTAIAVAVPIT